MVELVEEIDSNGVEPLGDVGFLEAPLGRFVSLVIGTRLAPSR